MEDLVDYETLATGKFIDERKKNSRKRKDDEAVDDLVKFLLSPDNVHTYSWGTIVKDLSEHEKNCIPKASTYIQLQGLTFGYDTNNILCKR